MRLKHTALTASLLTSLTFVAPGEAAEEKHNHAPRTDKLTVRFATLVSSHENGLLYP